ncbi:MAG: biotin--[acetyl-CoA-carboxylase] ligase [Nitrosospira sp.]|nr:biotin--[acetyl-CoA-carboxylase] ligase [Nitrosospira sp.]
MKPLTFSILRQLSDNEFHSGTIIAQARGISRASVSNALRGLDDVGLEVQKVNGRGYRLLGHMQWLDPEIILKYLGGEAGNFKIEVLNSVDSTSSFLLKEAARGADAGSPGTHVVAAELQSGGRGRRGRQWHSGLGDGLVFSLLWRFQRGAGFLSGLSLAVGVAIIRSLESCGINGAMLKWPNDVVHNMCKLAGTLIELQGDMLGPTVAVIGVGMNLKLSNNIRTRIDQGVTDVYSISGEIADRNKLLAVLLINILAVLREFEDKGFGPFREEWSDYHAWNNKTVKLGLPNGSRPEGVIHGVADDGSLLLRTSSGIRSYGCGEITFCRTG